MSMETGPVFVMMEGIDVDITQSMARIVVNGIDIPFTSVRTSRWHIGPADDLIVSTKQRIEEFYQLMRSQVPVMIVMHFLQGAEYMRFAQIIRINESVTGEYTYYFSWG